MRRRLREHPDYPFSEGNLEATILEIEQFFSEPPPAPAERGELLEFVRLTRQYAFLERLVQGDVIFDLPIHFDLLKKEGISALEQVESLADEERKLLGLGMEPAVDLLDVLESRGIKVFRRTRGPELVETCTGGFHFVGELGPSLLLGAAEGSLEAAFILAHEYGHLVMDVDPYESRFCRWRRSDLSNQSAGAAERRSDRFARALLLPEDLVAGLAPELGLNVKVGAPADEMLVRAAEVFDVSPAVLWHRLGDLDLARPQGPPAAELPPTAHVSDERRPTDLPERFVNLALAAFGRRLMEKGDLARFLRLSPDGLERFLAWCPVPREPKEVGAPPEDEEDPWTDTAAG